MDDRDAIFNDFFLLYVRYAPFNSLALPPFKSWLGLLLELIMTIRPAFGWDYAIACVTTQILHILQRVTKLALSLTSDDRRPLHLLLSYIALTMAHLVIGLIGLIIPTLSSWLWLIIWLATMGICSADNWGDDGALGDWKRVFLLVVDLVRVDSSLGLGQVWIHVSPLILVVILVELLDNCRSVPLLFMFLKLDLRYVRIYDVVWVDHAAGRWPVILILA